MPVQILDRTPIFQSEDPTIKVTNGNGVRVVPCCWRHDAHTMHQEQLTLRCVVHSTLQLVPSTYHIHQPSELGFILPPNRLHIVVREGASAIAKFA
mmetsp:Transcript_5420/g.11705  ORF Transcript_5420/g.11705 Transcript_5420/m.11705 type:complete len:96 (-) Transcript_5420:381-668(-)